MWNCPKCGEKVEFTFEVCWNCGTSREGEEDPSFKKADEDEEEKRQELTLSPPQPAAPQCPNCRGTRLDHGSMGTDVRFFRAKQWISLGWNIQAFVCLDCGVLTHYLSADDLESLRARQD